MKIEKINLLHIYQTLEKVIGEESYVLVDLIKKLQKVTPKDPLANIIETFAISRDGTLFINRDFCAKHIKNETALTVVFLHEIHHPILGDLSSYHILDAKDPEFQIKKLAQNIAQDSRINAGLSLLYKEINPGIHCAEIYKSIEKEIEEERKKLDPEYQHTPEILHKLLYPGNAEEIGNIIGAKAQACYESFYKTSDFKSFSDLYIEVLNYLRKNKEKYDKEGNDIICIGGHQEIPKELKEKIEGLSSEQKEKIRRKIIQSLRNRQLKESSTSTIPLRYGDGSGKNLEENIILIENVEGFERKKIDSSIFKRLAVRAITHNILLSATVKQGRWTESPVIPYKISKVDLIKMSCGIPVRLYKHKKYVKKFIPQLVPIYFDVSGSMTSYIPKILDLILNMDERIEHIWCFSTYVEQHTFQQLKDRKISSSGGTSFDCVIEHAVQNKFTDLLVITDGQDVVRTVNGKHPEINSVCTILVEGSNENNWFSDHYNNTHQLDDIIK